MKLIIILLIGATVALSSCSSARHTTQSSDDLYYSPDSRNASSNNNGEYYNANPSDQYLMMKVQDPSRWSSFDDYSYDGFYSPYNSFGYGAGYYSAFSPWLSFGFWNPYFGYMNSYYMWNTFYNPYYYGVVIVNPHYPSYYNAYTGLHPFNVNAYRAGLRPQSVARSFYAPNNKAGTSYNSRSYYRNNSNQRTNNFNSRPSQPARTFSAPSNFGGGSRSGGFGRPGKG